MGDVVSLVLHISLLRDSHVLHVAMLLLPHALACRDARLKDGSRRIMQVAPKQEGVWAGVHNAPQKGLVFKSAKIFESLLHGIHLISNFTDFCITNTVDTNAKTHSQMCTLTCGATVRLCIEHRITETIHG